MVNAEFATTPPGAPLSLSDRIVLLKPTNVSAVPVFTRKAEPELRPVTEPALMEPALIVVVPV